MHFETVYDVNATSLPTAFWLLGVTGVCLGLIPILTICNRKQLSAFHLLCGLVWSGMAFGFFCLPTLLVYLRHDGLVRKLREGSVQVAEGEISNVTHPVIKKRTYERFSVDGVSFQYTDNANGTLAHTLGVDIVGDAVGFHRTNQNGGPIRKGLRVRVSHFKGDIAKLEVVQ